ncbi:MAG: hypothetical protein AAH944_04350 [Dehalobacter sp. 4CP]
MSVSISSGVSRKKAALFNMDLTRLPVIDVSTSSARHFRVASSIRVPSEQQVRQGA